MSVRGAKKKAAIAEAPEAAPDAVPVLAYKGFDKNLRCKDFQFEIGKSYEHSGAVKACQSGFHACVDPIDVWGYYGPGDSRFAVVELSGELSRHDSDSKIAAAKITVKAELSLPQFIGKAVDFILSRVDWANAKESNTGNYSAATNTGNRSAATVGGKHSVALASGYGGRVSGANGCALFLVERNDNYEILSAWAGIVGRDGIKPDTFYILKNGKPVEWSAQ